MRTVRWIVLWFATALFVAGCGTNAPTDVTGNWLGSSTSTAAGPSLSFTFSMQEGTSNGNTIPVTFSNLAFQTANNCFDNTATILGNITPAIPRTFAIDIFSGANMTGNHDVLHLVIAADNNSATGTYNLTGGVNGCNNDAGNVTFTRQ